MSLFTARTLKIISSIILKYLLIYAMQDSTLTFANVTLVLLELNILE
jgi:hypothetical protein